MTLPSYFYGSCQINATSGGFGYVLLSKNLDFPDLKPQTSPIARYDGYKITGYQVGLRQIQCDIVVIGSSRIDLMARIDALYAALALRDQQLTIHEDGRYWVANAVAGKAQFSPGRGILQVTIPVTFVCASPYSVASSAATPYDTGVVQLTTQTNGVWISPTFTSSNPNATTYSWPTITLTHKTPAQASTTLKTTALVAGNNYTNLTVNSAPALTAGTALLLVWVNGSSTNVQRVIVSSTVIAGAGSIPVNSFTAGFSFPVTNTTVEISTIWTSVSVLQTTDNYTLSFASATPNYYSLTNGGGFSAVGSGAFCPQFLNDQVVLNCDPTSTVGSVIEVELLPNTYFVPLFMQPVGSFPVIEPSSTNWQVQIVSDFQPSIDLNVAWTPRYLS